MTGNRTRETGGETQKRPQVRFEPWAAAAKTRPLHMGTPALPTVLIASTVFNNIMCPQRFF